MTPKIRQAIILILTLCACGPVDHTGQPFSDASIIADAGLPVITSSASSSSSILTSDGGSVSITQNTTVTALASGETLEGFTAKSSVYYLLVAQNGGGSWDFRSSTSVTTTFSTTCSLTPDGSFDPQTGVAFDGSSFYVMRTTTGPVIRKFSGTTCATQANLDTTAVGDDISAPFAVSGTALLWNQVPTGGTPSAQYLAQTNTTSATTSEAFGNQTVSSQTTQFGNWVGPPQGYSNGNSGTVALAVVGTTLYAVFMSNWKIYLWKLSTTGTAVGWAALPTDTFPTNYYGNYFLGAPDATHIVFATQAGTSVRYVTLDVSHF